MCLGVFHLGFILFGTLGFLNLCHNFLPHFGEVSAIISSSIFSCPSFLSSCSGTPMIRMFGRFTLSQRFLRLSSFLLILFSFFPLCFIYFHHFIFYLTYPIFCLHYSTLGSLESFLSHLLCYSFLIDSIFFLVKHFLHLLNPCLQVIYL